MPDNSAATTEEKINNEGVYSSYKGQKYTKWLQFAVAEIDRRATPLCFRCSEKFTPCHHSNKF